MEQNDFKPTPEDSWRDTRENLRTEYQVCQQSADANGSSFWTLSGIFIAFSSVLLSGVIFGLLSNNSLLDEYVKTSTFSASASIFTARILTIILGIGMIIIYLALRRWQKRVRFLAKIKYERMNQLELELNMQQGMLVQGIDDWDMLPKEQQERLTTLNLKKWCDEKRKSKEYETPSRRTHFPIVMNTLIGLWIFTILAIWFLPLFYHWFGIH
jgi:hypothetical protein